MAGEKADSEVDQFSEEGAKMVDVTKDVSNKISNMGFVSACLVVFIHCPKTGDGTIQFFHNMIPGFLTFIPVAYFFIVSGFFLCRKFEERKVSWLRCYWTELRKRWWSLMLPYLVLNLLWFGCILAYQWPNVRLGETDVVHRFVWVDILTAIGLCGNRYPVDGPLWFVRSLFFFSVVVSPIFLVLKRQWMAWVLCVCFFVANCFGWDWLGCDSFVQMFAPEWVLFFLLGAALGVHGLPKIEKGLGVSLFTIGMVVALLSRQGCFHNEIVGHFLSWVNRPLLIGGLWALMPSVAWPKTLTENAFPVFALHWPIVMGSYIVSEKLGMYTHIFGNCFGATVYMVVVVLLTILGAKIIRRSVFLGQYVLGGR